MDYQDIPRPIGALADEYPDGHIDPRHSHARAQLVYSTTGVMTVITDQASFVVPPQRAVWVPARVEHEVHCRGTVTCRTVYVTPDAVPGLPTVCRVIEVSDLLRALIVEATHLPIEYAVNGRDGRVMALILDDIIASQSAPLHVPMPHHPRLVPICVAILRDPAQHDVLDEWADIAGMGRRTFTRCFRKETGMSFATWRQNVRLIEALSRLALGETVTRVALDVGYNSPSAFAAMFRRAFGVPPSHYLPEHAQAG
ncbi:MAG: AraC family transcriptional regulator [Gammaproteobacteria bacterium]|nr:MAG: AraC family transcriptional regulator [Gammaproteobacteria bacterium]